MHVRLANTGDIRAGAQLFASAALEARQKAIRLNQVKTSFQESSSWKGSAAESFFTVMERLQEDINTTAEAFDRIVDVLHSLAVKLEQVNSLRQQAENIQWEIASLERSLLGAEENRRTSLQSEISTLSYRYASLMQEADTQEFRANENASHEFYEIGSLVNRLYFANGGSLPSGGTISNLLDEVGNFFSSFKSSVEVVTHEVKDELEKVEQTIVKSAEQTLEFAMEMADDFKADLRNVENDVQYGFDRIHDFLLGSRAVQVTEEQIDDTKQDINGTLFAPKGSNMPVLMP